MKQPFDPKLKTAAKEIREILDRHDVAAYISLVSPTHSEFVLRFPTWSGVQREEPHGLRIKLRAVEVQKVEATTWMVVGMSELLTRGLEMFSSVFGILRQNALISISNAEDRFTPHDPSMDEKKD